MVRFLCRVEGVGMGLGFRVEGVGINLGNISVKFLFSEWRFGV